MSGENSMRRACRLAYGIELVVIALPLLPILGLIALLGAVYCGFSTLIGLFRLIEIAGGGYPDGDAATFLILGGAGTLISLSGLAAIFKFVRVSFAYLFRSTAGFGALRREFNLGLAFAAAPLMVTAGFAVFVLYLEQENWPLRIILSGAILLIPVIHLWLALRKAGQAPA